MELVPLKNGKWLTVRAAEPGDAAAFMAFSRLVGRETDNLMLDSRGFFGTVEEKAEYLSAALADRRYCIMLAMIEGEMVGFFSIAPMGDGKLRGNAGFGIAVRKSCWRLGIGAILTVIAIDYAKEAGYHKICLDVRADNERAIRLYKRFGFAQCGLRREQLFINGEYYDEMMMELML